MKRIKKSVAWGMIGTMLLLSACGGEKEVALESEIDKITENKENEDKTVELDDANDTELEGSLEGKVNEDNVEDKVEKTEISGFSLELIGKIPDEEKNISFWDNGLLLKNGEKTRILNDLGVEKANK